jgi:RNA-directed DNA polymerase
MHNPCIRGWIGYYGHFYKEQLRPTLKRIDAYVFGGHAASSSGCAIGPKWHGIGSPLRRANPNPHLFAHWVLCHGNGRTSGAV